MRFSVSMSAFTSIHEPGGAIPEHRPQVCQGQRERERPGRLPVLLRGRQHPIVAACVHREHQGLAALPCPDEERSGKHPEGLHRFPEPAVAEAHHLRAVDLAGLLDEDEDEPVGEHGEIDEDGGNPEFPEEIEDLGHRRRERDEVERAHAAEDPGEEEESEVRAVRRDCEG